MIKETTKSKRNKRPGFKQSPTTNKQTQFERSNKLVELTAKLYGRTKQHARRGTGRGGGKNSRGKGRSKGEASTHYRLHNTAQSPALKTHLGHQSDSQAPAGTNPAGGPLERPGRKKSRGRTTTQSPATARRPTRPTTDTITGGSSATTPTRRKGEAPNEAGSRRRKSRGMRGRNNGDAPPQNRLYITGKDIHEYNEGVDREGRGSNNQSNHSSPQATQPYSCPGTPYHNRREGDTHPNHSMQQG